MNIMTESGVRDFYKPETPTYPPEHVKRVSDFVSHMNSTTIAGWERKYPCNPPLVFEEELKKQVNTPWMVPPVNFPYSWE